MPAIPSFINSYKPGRKAKAAIKSSLSRFNRSEPSTNPQPDIPPDLGSPAVSAIIDIKDDRSSLDFDGGQPDEYTSDLVDAPSPAPAKLEITLPPELRIDWFAERQAAIDANRLDQDTKDTLAGKVKDDHGLVETLEDALARHVDSNPSRLVTISGLDLKLDMSPTKVSPPISDDLTDEGPRRLPRDSLTMLTSRLSISDTPASSAMSGTTLARALISNTFAMPIDPLSEVGLTRSDSTVLPRDSLHRMFSIAPDAPPMPLDAEILYVAPKRPRIERRKQLKRRSSTGTLNTKSLPDIPASRRTSLNLSSGSEFESFFRSQPWSSEIDSPILSIPTIPESTTPITPHTETPKSEVNSLTLPPLPEGIRRLPDPRLQPPASAGISPSISSKSSRELDTKGLEDVLEYYNLGESPAPLVAGASFRPGVSPIREETSSQLSPNSPFRNEGRDSKRMPPVGARSPRSRIDSAQLGSRFSDVRSPSKPLLSPSRNDSTAALSENSGSLKSSRSFDPHRSDSTSSHGNDPRNPNRQQTLSSPLPTSASGVETSSLGEDVHRSNYDPRRNIPEDGVFANNSDSASPQHVETHAQELPPSQTPALTVSSPLIVRNGSLPLDSPLVILNRPMACVGAVNQNNSVLSVEENGLSHHATVPDRLVHDHHDEFLNRASIISMGSPPPYSEVAHQGPIHPRGSNPAYFGPSASDPVAGPSRSSGEWNNNESRRDSPAKTRVRPRPPLPIGPRRPSQGLPPNVTFPHARDRSGSLASISQPGLSRQRSARITAIPSPKFQTPLPKWRGHTMDAARWTFKSSQLQAIVSRAIKHSSEASLIRLLEPELLENDVPAEIEALETLRTDLKTRYKLHARRRATLLETLSSVINTGLNTAEEGPGYAHRLLEEISEIAATMDNLSEELHSADIQLAYLDSLTQVHMSSALAVALRKLNASFLKQMAENENLRNELFSVEAERDEAWRQAERIALELDQLATTSENSSPILSNRSSRVLAHRKSMVHPLKMELMKGTKRRFSKRLSLSATPASASGLVSAFVSPGVGPKAPRHSKILSPPPTRKRPPVPNLTEAALLTPIPVLPTSMYTPSSATSATRALIQAQDELYAMLGLAAPESSLHRSRSWIGLNPSSPREPISPNRRRSGFLPSDGVQPRSDGLALARRSSLPLDSTLAQVSNAMAADRKAMLVTFDILSANDTDNNPSI